MSERNRIDAVRKLAEDVLHGAETAAATSKDVADLAIGAGKDVADSAIDKSKDAAGTVLGLGKNAVTTYIDQITQAVDKSTKVISKLGHQVVKLPLDVKERLFGDDEPSLGDHPKDTK